MTRTESSVGLGSSEPNRFGYRAFPVDTNEALTAMLEGLCETWLATGIDVFGLAMTGDIDRAQVWRVRDRQLIATGDTNAQVRAMQVHVCAVAS